MNTPLPSSLLSLFSFFALTSCAAPPAPPPPSSPADDVAAPTRETLVAAAAARVCAALDRCCDEDAQARFFSPWVASESFDDLDPRLPPAATVSADACPPLVVELLERRPLGAWLAAVDRGEVALDVGAAQTCLAALDETCGPALAAALEDSTCFAFGPPVGGDEQRKLFTRTAVAGPCTALDDGVGGVLYGTCDPQRSFCCVGEEGCAFAAPGDIGTCVPVAGEGEACGFAPLALCQTGASCDFDDVCRSPGDAPLQLGERCLDDSFIFTGTCTEGFCDALGSNTCKPTVDMGAPCNQAEQCGAGICTDGVCAAESFCRGQG